MKIVSDARVVELVDTQDLKSCVLWDVRVQVPSRVLKASQSIDCEAFFVLRHQKRPQLLFLTIIDAK